MFMLVCSRSVYGFDSNAFAAFGADGFGVEAQRDGVLPSGFPRFTGGGALVVVRLRSGSMIITVCVTPRSLLPPESGRLGGGPWRSG